jgi:HAD superfamily hydrolase (TIGR01549 family)
MIRAVIFDWGDTLMRDFPEMQGPMAYWPTVEVIEGVVEAIEGLERGLICCVASNAGASDAELMALALERAGIHQYFQHFFTSRELGTSKPDRRFFVEVARRVDVEPKECVMIGNDYLKDIAGAKRAGMHTVWFKPCPSQAAVGTDADFVIESMTELPGIMRKLIS